MVDNASEEREDWELLFPEGDKSKCDFILLLHLAKQEKFVELERG